MMRMLPPTSTDEQGTVIDGTAHSAEWREKQRAAQRPQESGPPEASPSVPAAEFDPAAAKDFVSSLMIPAKLVSETPQKPATTEAPDAYINTLLDESPQPQPPQEPEVDASASSAQSDELDRFFEKQAISLPHAPAAQALPRGSASLDIEPDPGAGAERARNGRALHLPRAHARETGQRHHRPTARRRDRARMHLTRTRILAGSMIAVLSTIAIAIAANGSPAHRSPLSPAPRSTSTTFASLLHTFVSKAGRLPGLESLSVRAPQQHRPSHRTHRPAPRRPIARTDASTSAAHSTPYTPRLTSQTDSSPAPTASASTSTSASGPTASTSSGGSSPAASSSPQARTGPSGPISLIGAGTTPSG